MIRLTIIAVVGALSLFSVPVKGAEPETFPSFTEMNVRFAEMKDQWSQAAAKVTSLHAEIRRIKYDHVYSIVSELEGTLDFEHPNRYRLELRPVSSNHRKPVEIDGVEYRWDQGSAQTFIWTGEETVIINHESRIFDIISTTTPENSSLEPPTAPVVESPSREAGTSDRKLNWDVEEKRIEEIQTVYEGDPFWELLVSFLQPRQPSRNRPAPDRPVSNSWSWFQLPSPNVMLQMLVSKPDDIVDEGHQLVPLNHVKKGIAVIPNAQMSRPFGNYSRIDLLFDSETRLPYASRTVDDQARSKIVLVLKNVKLNSLPERNDLFEPNLEQLKLAGYTGN